MIKAEQKERKLELSFINVILCIFVVLIHLISPTLKEFEKTQTEYAVLSVLQRMLAFVVQGFIVLSGVKLTMKGTEHFSYGKFYFSRFRKIILPYCIWFAIYYGYYLYTGFFKYDQNKMLEYFVRGSIVSPFYFIIIIVQFYALAPLWIMIVKRVKSSIMLPIALLIMIILGQNLPQILSLIIPHFQYRNNDRTLTTYLFYWLAGCYIGMNYRGFQEEVKKHWLCITIIFVLVTAANIVCSDLVLTGQEYLMWLETLHILYCIFALLFLDMLGLYFTGNPNKKHTVLKALDRGTFYIYLAHCLPIIYLNDYFATSKNQITDVWEQFWVRLLVTYVTVVLISVLYSNIKYQMYRLITRNGKGKHEQKTNDKGSI